MASSFATFLFSPGAQEMFRVCIAEAGRFPELGAAFHASGPARAHARLAAFFEAAAPGAISPSTTRRPPPSSSPRSARPGSSCARCSAARPPSEEEIARIADEAVRTFLARYGKDRGGRSWVNLRQA